MVVGPICLSGAVVTGLPRRTRSVTISVGVSLFALEVRYRFRRAMIGLGSAGSRGCLPVSRERDTFSSRETRSCMPTLERSVNDQTEGDTGRVDSPGRRRGLLAMSHSVSASSFLLPQPHFHQLAVLHFASFVTDSALTS